MGLPRLFLNLIVDNHIPGAKSLRCIDLMRHKLFNTKVPVLPLHGNGAAQSELPQEESTLWPVNRKNKMAMIQLPDPIFNFRGSGSSLYWYINCFPLAGRKVLCADQLGRTSLFDADMRQLEDLPYLDTPKRLPISIFVPSADTDDHDNSDGGHGSIYIMEGRPSQEQPGDGKQLSHQYEAFVYRRPTLTSFTKSWQRQLLPPPPFVCDPKVVNPRITSYVVLDGGSHICISVDGGAGTYYLDTAKHTWTQLGDWTLPFVGKVEYVPELKLWFGICAKDWQLGAADLSTMDMDSQQPQLVGAWKELDAPQEWTELQCPQLVNLGFGRFCVARFFQYSLHPLGFLFDSSDLVDEQYLTVLTGMDLVPCFNDANATCDIGNGSNGKLQLQMIKHNSRAHMSYGSDGTIDLVF